MLTISAGTFACKHRLRASAPRLRELARSSPTCAARLDRTTDERHGDKASRSASLRPSALWERIDLLLDRLDFFFADDHGPSKSNATTSKRCAPPGVGLLTWLVVSRPTYEAENNKPCR